MKLRERISLWLVFSVACCGCSHEVRPISQAQVRTVSACLDACPGASAVITANIPEKGQMCRCWAPNAFSYTFTYPDTAEEFDYVKLRWSNGMKAADQCRAKGFGWEPDETRESIVCVKPTSEAEEEDPLLPLKRTMLNGRNKPAPRWLRLTPWESWRPKIWKKSA